MKDDIGSIPLDGEPIADSKVRNLSPLSLAFVGDGVLEIYVRGWLIRNIGGKAGRLHSLTIKFVKASEQAKSLKAIMDILDDNEIWYVKRGRNTASAVPKNSKVADYRMATGLETLLGYLYLSGKRERLDELISVIIKDKQKTLLNR